MTRFLAAATGKSTVATSTKIALFVGTILAVINYGGADWAPIIKSRRI